MIVEVGEGNLRNAAYIHAVSFKEYNKEYYDSEFLAEFTVKRQEGYIKTKMESGSIFYMLVDEMPVGIVSIRGALLEDLYVLPEFQNMGYGTELLDYASKNCIGKPTIWVTEGNEKLLNMLEIADFRRTGKVNEIADDLFEFEMKEEKIIELDTLRLKIRRYTVDDFDDLYECLSNKEVLKYASFLPMNEKEVRGELNKRINSGEYLAIELKENARVIGSIYIGEREYDSIELKYMINNRYWNQGFGKEAVKNVVNYLFEIGVHKIYSYIDTENEDAISLLEKLDFDREAYLKKDVYFFKDQDGNPIFRDRYIYSKIRED